MKSSLTKGLIIIEIISILEAKVVIVPDQKFEDCTEGSENARVFDFSNFELVPVNDTHTYTNGSWKFLHRLQSPWRGSMTTEKYVRGEWLMQAFSRKYADICSSFHNPLEPFYDFTKDMAGCPAEKGSTWIFDMKPIIFPQAILSTIPPHYVGRWRAIFIGEFEIIGEKVKDCKRAYADVFEE